MSQEWSVVLEGEGRNALEAALPAFLMSVRWFGGKARTISGVKLEGAIPIVTRHPTPDTRHLTPARWYVTTISVSYADGGSQSYVLPLALANGEQAERVQRDYPGAVLTQ